MHASHSHCSTKAPLPPALGGGMAGAAGPEGQSGNAEGSPSPSPSPRCPKPARALRPAGLGKGRGGPALPQQRRPESGLSHHGRQTPRGTEPAAEGEPGSPGARGGSGDRPAHPPSAPAPPGGAGAQRTAPAQ